MDIILGILALSVGWLLVSLGTALFRQGWPLPLQSKLVKRVEALEQAAQTPPESPSQEPSECLLMQRAKKVGMSWGDDLDVIYEQLPASIRDEFVSEDAKAVCAACAHSVYWIWIERELHPGQSLGVFCLDCGKGCLFETVNELRKSAGSFDQLPDGQLMDVIKALEAQTRKLKSDGNVIPIRPQVSGS